MARVVSTIVFILVVDIPVSIAYHELVASADKQYLYNIGNNYSTQEIYKFSCAGSIDKCAWTKIETKLQYGRYRSVAFPIPNVLANKLCN